MTRTLHIVANAYFLTDFLLDAVKGCEDIRVIRHPQPRRGWHWSVLKSAETYVLRSHRFSWFFGQEYVKAYAGVGPDDSVLFFGVDNIKELRIATRFVPTHHVSVFVWNPVQDFGRSSWSSRKHGNSLALLGERVCTFDPGDADRFQLKLVNQVYRDVSAIRDESVQPDIDVFFVGYDKGRLPVLRQWHGLLTAAGLDVHFRVVRDKRKTYLPQDDVSFLSPGGLSYPDTLKWIQRSRCLLDIAQENQSGLTVRALEAFFFRKKLITNNQAIVGSDLYDPSRVFVIGRDDPATIVEFLAGAAVPVSDAVLRKHDFRHWCRQFLVAPNVEEPPMAAADRVTVYSMYWDNISPAIRKAQQRVFAALGIPLVQEDANLMPHGEWMTDVLSRHQPDDVVVFCDIDAFPLTLAAYVQAMAAARQGVLFGLAQFSNHKRGQDLYAGPMFMAFRKSVWESLGSPALAADKRYDAAEGLSAAARQRGIQVQMVMPTACLIPKWPLANRGVFGIGTFYGDCEFFHLFESRRAAHEPLLLNVAQDVIDGRKPDFGRYLELTATVASKPVSGPPGKNWVPKPLRRFFARRPQ
jgi:hypothetical protein